LKQLQLGERPGLAACGKRLPSLLQLRHSLLNTNKGFRESLRS
jgi:hypothetical protein